MQFQKIIPSIAAIILHGGQEARGEDGIAGAAAEEDSAALAGDHRVAAARAVGGSIFLNSL